MIINPDPRKRHGSMTIAVQRVNTIQTVPYVMPVPRNRSSSTSRPQLPSIWAHNINVKSVSSSKIQVKISKKMEDFPLIITSTIIREFVIQMSLPQCHLLIVV